jgi:hypothetical protein
VKVEEDVFEASAVTVLGCVLTTSEPHPSLAWLSVFVKKDDGALRLPVVCRLVHLTNVCSKWHRRAVTTKDWAGLDG